MRRNAFAGGNVPFGALATAADREGAAGRGTGAPDPHLRNCVTYFGYKRCVEFPHRGACVAVPSQNRLQKEG